MDLVVYTLVRRLRNAIVDFALKKEHLSLTSETVQM